MLYLNGFEFWPHFNGDTMWSGSGNTMPQRQYFNKENCMSISDGHMQLTLAALLTLHLL